MQRIGPAAALVGLAGFLTLLLGCTDPDVNNNGRIDLGADLRIVDIGDGQVDIAFEDCQPRRVATVQIVELPSQEPVWQVFVNSTPEPFAAIASGQVPDGYDEGLDSLPLAPNRRYAAIVVASDGLYSSAFEIATATPTTADGTHDNGVCGS